MATVKLILEKKRPLKSGTYPLVFRIIHKRDKRIISTSFKLYEAEFDGINQNLIFMSDDVKTHRSVSEINRKLQDMRLNIETYIRTREEQSIDYTVEQIVSYFKPKDRNLIYQIDLLIEQKILMEKLGTARAYRSTKSTLIKFKGKQPIDINSIDAVFVKSYEVFLKKSGVSDNTINFYFRNIKSIYNQIFITEIDKPILNPFVGCRRKVVKTAKRAIPKNLISEIKKLDINTLSKSQIFSKDLFMFSFYTRGMPLVDIVNLKKIDINCNSIIYKRKKTHQQLRVKLVDEALEIIKKYDNDSEYAFPIITSTLPVLAYKQYTSFVERINRHLKQIGKIINIGIPLTTYVARHSWATIAKQIGVTTSIISESLGHSSERMTQIYLKEFENEVIDDVNRKIANLI